MFVKGEGLQRPVRLMKANSKIGRAETADVQLPHESVSEQHAELSFDGTNWTEEDCPVSSHLEAVGGYGSEVVAVGDRGLVLTRTDEGWVDRSILDRLVSLDSLWGDGRQLFATTHRGAVLRYDGSRWRMETTGQSGFVRAVQADTAVGANGLVMHRSRTSP